MAFRAQRFDDSSTAPAAIEAASGRARALSEAASILLDVVRFGAAILVVLAHVGHGEIATGFRNRQVLGQVAVPVFFVLSGFVIRFVTRARDHTLRRFLIDRAARMYSVMLPAMALTLVLSYVSWRLAPGYYARYFGGSSDHVVTRVLFNLACVSQSWGHTTIPLINLPFWSLSYECLYYVAYGLACFLRGWRRVAGLACWALVAGPQVLFLLPVWWLGCWIYDGYFELRLTPAGRVARLLTLLAAGGGAGAAMWGPGLLKLAGQVLGCVRVLPHPLLMAGIEPRRATLEAVAIGGVAGAVLLGLLLLSDLVPVKSASRLPGRVRVVADGTFSIYLMHYPLMVLATAAGWYRPGRAWVSVAITVLLCVSLIVAARGMDGLKRWMRRGLDRLLPEGEGTRGEMAGRAASLSGTPGFGVAGVREFAVRERPLPP